MFTTTFGPWLISSEVSAVQTRHPIGKKKVSFWIFSFMAQEV